MAKSRTLRKSYDAWTSEAFPKENHGQAKALNLNNAASAKRYAWVFFELPFDPGDTVVSATLKMYLKGAWSGTHTVTAKRVQERWREDVTYATQPSDLSSSSASAVVTDGVDNQELAITVTTLLQQAAAGKPYFGFRLEIDTAGVKKLHSSESTVEGTTPILEVTWGRAPNKPTSLKPAGGRAISTAKPLLMWDFDDVEDDGTQSQARVQLATSNAVGTDGYFSSPVWDSGFFALTEPELDLASNLLTYQQSSLEDGTTTGWVGAGNFTIANESAQAKHGSKSLKLTDNTTGGSPNTDTVSTPTGTGGRAVTAGKSYVALVHLKAATTGRSAFARIAWYNASGAFLSNSDGAQSTTTTTDWTAVSVTATAPTNAAFAAIEVLILNVADGEVHYLDAAMLAQDTVVPSFRPAFDDLANDAERYWLVDVKDNDGIASGPSSPRKFVRKTKGTLAITAPSAGSPATVEDTTPKISHSFTGRTQEAVRHELFEDQLLALLPQFYQSIYRTGRRATSSPDHTIPSKDDAGDRLIKYQLRDYKIRVRVWDTIDREDMPGDPSWVQAERVFRLVRSATPAPVGSLTATPSDHKVVLAWSRSVRPDFFELVVDGETVEDRIDPDDVETSVGSTTYQMTYWRARPTIAQTYEIVAVVNSSGTLKRSQSNPTATATTTPTGVWLVLPDEQLDVLIAGTEEVPMSIGEDATTHFPKGSRRPVRVTRSIRGYEGEVDGIVANRSGRTPRQWRNRLENIRGWVNRVEQRLVLDDQNLKVSLGDFAIAYRLDGRIGVSFSFWQIGDFTFRVKGQS